MVKICLFKYYMNRNKVYAHDLLAEQLDNGDYRVYETKPDDYEYILKSEINTVKVYNCDDDEIIYVYSDEDNVNKVLELIRESMENLIDRREKQLNVAKQMYAKFSIEQKRIREEYSDGVRV